MNFNTNLSIDFLKSQPTVGELSKVVKEAQSLSKHNNDNRGDEFVARKGNNQYPHEGSNGFFTSFQEDNVLPDSQDLTLMPQTLNFTKLNNARRDLEWQKEMKELNIQQL